MNLNYTFTHGLVLHTFEFKLTTGYIHHGPTYTYEFDVDQISPLKVLLGNQIQSKLAGIAILRMSWPITFFQ